MFDTGRHFGSTLIFVGSRVEQTAVNVKSSVENFDNLKDVSLLYKDQDYVLKRFIISDLDCGLYHKTFYGRVVS